MNISAPFIKRPVATTLITLAIALAGALGYFSLPVSPLPQVDFPTIMVQAQLPGASPDVAATSLAEPLERHLGQIADVTEMTSQSQTGQSRVILQFGLDRNIDGAAKDVQAAINAAQADLPTNLLTQPTYRKVNPADAPILILTLTSKTLTPVQMYDVANTLLAQQLSQISGVGQVFISGSALPAVRVELDPLQLFHFGIGLEAIRSALASANANAPKGAVDVGAHRWQIYTTDQASHAADFRSQVVAYRNGAAVKLSDVANVVDSAQDLRNLGLADGQPAVILVVFRQPGANIIQTVEAVREAVPKLKSALPAAMDIGFASDRSITIRNSLAETQRTLIIAMLLVVGVVFVFLQNGRAALVPAVAVPVSVIGTFGAMYLFGYSLDNLSLMALTISTGFVVDDAVVVLENISRHLEEGMPRLEAALTGARDIGFTIVSITLSLIAVFLPILLMGGIVGRLFREFAVTLSMAILISMFVALTTTPMMCAAILRVVPERAEQGRPSLFERARNFYARTLRIALDHSFLVLLSLFAAVAMNVLLLVMIPKDFFPLQDTGRIVAVLVADQSMSFQLLSKKLARMMAIVDADKDLASVVGYTGTGGGGVSAQTNTAAMFLQLKPRNQRDSIMSVIARLRDALAQVPGARLYLQPVQDIHVGGRQSNALYQYSILGDTTSEVYEWTPKLMAALEEDRDTFSDVSSDQQQNGLGEDVTVDRDNASRLGLTMYQIDNTLYDAFGQRAVSVIYNPLNQYRVVMEAAPRFWQRPDTLDRVWVSTSAAQPAGSQTTALSAGSVVLGSQLGVLPVSVIEAPPATPNLSAAAASATNPTAALSNVAVTLPNLTVSLATSNASSRTASSSSATNSASLAANNAVRTAAQATLAASGSTGSSSASVGAAVATSVETVVPLSAVAHFSPGRTPLAVNHQSQFVAATISFNLAKGKSLSDAEAAIHRAEEKIHMPSNLIRGFAGTALLFTQSLEDERLLVAAALIAIYIVLGVLYESFIHPITILSTLPSAGVGATLALLLFGLPFTIVALIGVILLIGIVKKNAILMIDVALQVERGGEMSTRDAIYHAAIVRFRPIIMTTTAALLGALPLCFSFGEGSELREPLGISIVGGLIVSQALTLYTTPIVYLYLDRMRLRFSWRRSR
ncbi:MAG TPA: efflux RND transporter permease subunit [Rhizobiaceae bacterium]|nr:efflux RND transporter permease subunit [Rhizobiaceae bacterium]